MQRILVFVDLFCDLGKLLKISKEDAIVKCLFIYSRALSTMEATYQYGEDLGEQGSFGGASGRVTPTSGSGSEYGASSDRSGCRDSIFSVSSEVNNAASTPALRKYLTNSRLAKRHQQYRSRLPEVLSNPVETAHRHRKKPTVLDNSPIVCNAVPARVPGPELQHPQIPAVNS